MQYLWMTFALYSLTISTMGGERQATTRMRMVGKICCFCHSSLPPPYPGKERVCERCQSQRSIHKLYMRFEKFSAGASVFAI